MRQASSRSQRPEHRRICCDDPAACSAGFARYRRSRDRETRNELALRHEWLADRYARSFSDRGQSVEDLTQVAWVGLIKAVERFDPERGVGFPTFATPTILGELKRHFRDHSWDLVVPRRAKEVRPAINAAVEVLRPRLGRAPTPDELAEHLGVEREVVLQTLAAVAAHRARSLDVGPEREVAISRSESDSWSDRADDRVMALAAMDRLGERDRLMLYLRFFADFTQAEIAERVGVSQVQVSRCLTASLAELRRQLAPTGGRID